MYHCFTAKPDLTPYRYLRPQVDLEERNKPGAWGADLSERFGFAKEDAADDILLNEVIRRSVKGGPVPYARARACRFRLPPLGRLTHRPPRCTQPLSPSRQR